MSLRYDMWILAFVVDPGLFFRSDSKINPDFKSLDEGSGKGPSRIVWQLNVSFFQGCGFYLAVPVFLNV